MSPIAQALIVGILAPGATAVAVAACARPWRPDEGGVRLAIASSLAVAAGYVLAHRGLAGELELAPLDVSGWLPHLVVAAVPAAAAAAAGPRKLAWGVRALVSAGAAYLVLRPQLDHQFEGAAGALALAAAAALLLGYWTALDRVVARATARVGAIVLVVATGACAAGAGLSGTLLIGQLAGAGAAALGGIMVVALVWRPAALVRGAVAAAAVLGWGAIAFATLYAAMPAMVAAELLVLPVAVLGVQVLGPSRGRLAVVAPVVAAVVVAAASAATALRAGADDGGSEYDYGYGSESSTDYGYQ